ncbi:hypothetical protein DFH06DRAFT_1213382 [Mycena polygramma]|nr:hypothetical protein DFH06DRAFT_1213382 [Mycena polygramma]
MQPQGSRALADLLCLLDRCVAVDTEMGTCGGSQEERTNPASSSVRTVFPPTPDGWIAARPEQSSNPGLLSWF